MLSLFPDLLAFGLAGAFILRLVLGVLFALSGLRALRTKKKTPARIVLGTLEIVGAVLLLVGLWTQGAALVLGAIAFSNAIAKYKSPKTLPESFSYYLLVFAATLSLLFTGAGFFALDLPL